uniref:hypothetical protein n=1 Tax=Stenotrophomonas maltophilia TaxID=40324 RepID=UPI001954FFD2
EETPSGSLGIGLVGFLKISTIYCDGRIGSDFERCISFIWERRAVFSGGNSEFPDPVDVSCAAGCVEARQEYRTRVR